MKKNPTLLIGGCVWAACIAVAFFSSQTSVIGDQAAMWLLEIEVFSGRPNPTLVLTTAEVARVEQVLSEIRPAEKGTEAAAVFPPRLGYRGLWIRKVRESEHGRGVEVALRIRGPHILLMRGQEQSLTVAKSAELERFLLDVAVRRGAITEELGREIQRQITGQ